MLEKTLALLNQIAPGSFVAEDEKCYDAAEIEALGRILCRLLWAPSQLRKKLQQLGVTLVPSNFYSEIPDIETIEKSFAAGLDEGFDYIFNDREMVSFLTKRLMPFAAEFAPPLAARHAGEFSWEAARGMFSYSDPTAYYCLIRDARPRTILEIGSGWSTLVADMACRANGTGRVICVEPHPLDFLRSVESVSEIVEQPVQQLDLAFFHSRLEPGDILFIDSTHTVKHGSDCLHLYLKILPRLAVPLFVHVHDIFLPRTLPLSWLRDEQLYWTEQYLVMAYLIDNRRTRVLYGSRYHTYRHNDLLTQFMHGSFEPGGGSLWFSQAAG